MHTCVYFRRALELKLFECVAKGICTPPVLLTFTLAAELVRAPLPRTATLRCSLTLLQRRVSLCSHRHTFFFLDCLPTGAFTSDYSPVVPQVALQAPKHLSCLVTVDRESARWRSADSHRILVDNPVLWPAFSSQEALTNSQRSPSLVATSTTAQQETTMSGNSARACE